MTATAEPKFTAVQVEGDCPRVLSDLGKQITAHLERARKAEEKADQHRIAAAQHLAQARDLCDADGFDAFHEKFCPDLGRSRTYELLAIATGKSSIEDTRASTRERVTRHRAKKAESVTVTDSTVPTSNGNDVDTEESAQRMASAHERASGDGDEEGAGDAQAHIGSAPTAASTRPGEVDEFVESPPAPEIVEPAPAAASPPAVRTAKSKTKPSLVESWDATPEERDTVRDLVLEDHYATADGRNILSRIRGPQRDRVIRDFLDALGVDGLRRVMSPEFRKGLRAELPGPNAWLVEKDAGTIARMIVEAAGRPKADTIRASLSPTRGKSARAQSRLRGRSGAVTG
jgi:hypothetical protein